jgi:hypothetical protein
MTNTAILGQLLKPFESGIRSDTRAATVVRSHLAFCIGIIGMATPYLIFLLLGPAARQSFTSEDNAVEYLGAFFWLCASALLLLECYRNAVRRPAGAAEAVNIWVLGLGLIFLAAFGEEISWGQRLAGFKTPVAVAAINLQHETNIHHLVIFNPLDESGRLRSGWRAMLNFSRLFNLFWLVVCVLVPLLNRAGTIKRFFVRIRLPIVSLELGSLFVINYAVLKLWGLQVGHVDQAGLTEVAEANFAFLFLLASCIVLRESGRKH